MLFTLQDVNRPIWIWMQIINAGTIGNPRYARFNTHVDDVIPDADGKLPTILTRQPYTKEMEHFILYEWGIHLIDVMRFLFGDIQGIYARMHSGCDLVKGEDMAILVMTFKNGMTGIIDISWGTIIPENKKLMRGNLDPFIVEGPAGSIELDPYQNDSFIITTGKETKIVPAHPEMTAAEGYQESYFNTQNHFVQSLLNNTPAENEAEDNLKTFTAMMTAYTSAKENQYIELQIPEIK